jgi:mono/diheme cytochrome c family protein
MRVNKQATMLCVAVLAFAFTLGTAPAADEFKAPADAAKVENPVPKTKENLARARLIYLKRCMSCHGITGKGDGPESAGLDPAPGNFTDAKEMNSQTDGELFWKISNGKGKMKPYSELVPANPEQDRWDLVNFVRTFAPAGKSGDAGGAKEKDTKDAPKASDAPKADQKAPAPADAKK